VSDSTDQGRLVAGRYRLLEHIGRGGMGTVWRSEDELLGRQVAVKRLHAPQAHMHEDELTTLFERTRREARSAARISHPNVVTVHDVVDDDGLPTIVMEYVPSITLGELIKRSGPVSPAEAARIGRGMIAALRAAHEAGVLHRDVKPGNVLLGKDGRVVLTDFGIAQASGTSTLTRTGELIGSIDFLAPERLTGGTPGPEADLWALGATLFQAVEGNSPFRKDTAIETAYAIAADDVPTAPNAGALEPLIAGLLMREPGERLSLDAAERLLRAPMAEPQTATGLRAGSALPPAPVRAGTQAEASTDSSPTGPTASVKSASRSDGGRARRRKRGVWVGSAVAIAALSAGGAVLATKIGGTGSTAQAGRPTPTVAQAVSPTASASPVKTTPTPSALPKVPAGYRLAKEPGLGFSVPVPDGWTRQANANGQDINYIDPTGLVGLKISVLDYASPDPVQHFKDVETQLTAASNPDRLQGYQRLRLQATSWRGQAAAIWDFTFTGKVRNWRAADLGFGKEGGRDYAVYLSAPDAEWATYRPVFDSAVAGLRLTG
jgi:tRNA A-37 threonylcarbamoyl transferase component Bud32